MNDYQELKVELDTMRRRVRRLSATNLLLAVVVLAFGGATAAYAVTLAPANSVNSAAIIDRTIGTPDVKVGAFGGQTILDNSMTGVDINESTLSIPGSAIVDGSVTAGKLAADAVRANSLGTITERLGVTTIPAGGNLSINVSCNSGERVIGGGHSASSYKAANVSSFISANGWFAAFRNDDTQSATIRARALCLAP